ncbi:MAG: hypothetical protein K6E40_12185 [Desulfovibrio sp.]|nr:hypothetical protein [Desulfovibrio sp.]
MGCKRIEIDVQRAAGLAQRGLSNHKIARAMGISPKTLERRLGEKSELAQAIAKARCDVEASLGDRILKLAKSDDAPPKVQLEAAKYFLTMRCGWTQAAAERVNGEDVAKAVPVRIDVKVNATPDSPEMEQMRLKWQYQYEVEHGLPVTVDLRPPCDGREDLPAEMPEICPVVG